MMRAEYYRAYRAANRDKKRAQARRLYSINRKRVMLRNARIRAKRIGVPCTLREQDIVFPTKCPALGVTLDYAVVSPAKDNSPSLDRIVPNLGYVPGNIAVISRRANVIKNNATVDELERIARWLRENLL